MHIRDYFFKDYFSIFSPSITHFLPSSLCLSGEAVFARCLSSLKDERVAASRSLSGPQGVKFDGDKAAFLEDIRKVEHTLLTHPIAMVTYCL